MMSSQQPKSQWLTAALSISITLALLSITASSNTVTSILYFWRNKTDSNSKADAKKKKIQELEASLKQALKNCAAERQGRIRAQQDLRDALSRSELYDSVTYPMPPIGVIKSCFSTRNGTPRQPLLVPQARATLTFDPKRVPPASLEGLEGYSHCWIIFVFHLNTNLEKLWKNPSQSRYKAKVRIPGLNGDKMGLFATRSPHRPCPIGLTVAKVESVCGHHVLLSGADLVDGTPVLDIKPYLPYCDNIPGATVPDWVKADNVLVVSSVDFTEGFSSSLADCWPLLEKRSLYATPDEFKLLIKQVLSWDIRSTPQRNRPHKPQTESEDASEDEETIIVDKPVGNGGKLVYHLTLENLDVWYKIDSNANVLVENITPMPQLCESENGSVANC